MPPDEDTRPIHERAADSSSRANEYVRAELDRVGENIYEPFSQRQLDALERFVELDRSRQYTSNHNRQQESSRGI